MDLCRRCWFIQYYGSNFTRCLFMMITVPSTQRNITRVTSITIIMFCPFTINVKSTFISASSFKRHDALYGGTTSSYLMIIFIAIIWAPTVCMSDSNFISMPSNNPIFVLGRNQSSSCTCSTSNKIYRIIITIEFIF